MIYLITPTADRPEAFSLCEKWMARQTIPFDYWIVADSGKIPAITTLGDRQVHVRSKWREDSRRSFCENLLSATNALGTLSDKDVVFIIEDDDYYLSDHIEINCKRLGTRELAGCWWLNYYNLRMRAWRILRNSCGALCNTVLRGSYAEALTRAARSALKDSAYNVDARLWSDKSLRGVLHGDITVYGMKGLPGPKGLGVGHRESVNWKADPNFEQLRRWLRDDASYYEGLNYGD